MTKIRRDDIKSLGTIIRNRRPRPSRGWAFGTLLCGLAGFAALAWTRPDAVPVGRMLQAIPQAFAHAAAEPVHCAARPAQLQQDLTQIAQNFDGKVGIAVAQAGCDWTVGERLDQYFPQQSVSKLWVAISTLDAVDRGKLRLDEPITLRPEDQVVFNQPLRWTVLKQGSLTLPAVQLMTDALSLSDNMANDKLLWRVGGPDHVRAVLAQRGITGVRFGPGERLLQSHIAGLTWTPDLATGYKFEEERAKLPIGLRKNLLSAYIDDPLDGATPAGIAGALGKLARGQLLSPASTDVLLGIMQHSKSGPQRLKGAIPPGWTVYHKTGTGQELAGVATGYNDVAVFQAPDGTRYAVAVMIGETRLPIRARMEMMQSVSRAVVAAHERHLAVS
ncbi:MAG: serine hydrolase [Novosphingobium sp.]